MYEWEGWLEIFSEVGTEEAASAWTADAVAVAAAEIGNLAGTDFGGGEALASASVVDAAPSGVATIEQTATTTKLASDNQSGNAAKLAQQILNPDTGSGASASETTAAERAFTYGAQSVPESKGIVGGAIDGVGQWIKDNSTAAAIAGTTIAGALGGAGKAALEKELAERKARTDKELLVARTDEQQRMSREGTYTGKPGTTPSGKKILYRADGTPVFVGGIINNQVPV